MNSANKNSVSSGASAQASPSLTGHLKIARFDHWIKNVFVLPGILVAMSMLTGQWNPLELSLRTVLGLLSVGLIASSNYVLNEVLDAPHDRHHPTKCRRPVPAGEVNIPLAYVQWLLLMAAGVAVGSLVSTPFVVSVLVLWLMGNIYNVRPIRSKDLPYLDVLSEAVNNPLRFLAGWFIVGPSTVPPASLLMSYWMVGCYFMAIKRFAEYNDIDSPEVAATYRKSFRFYNRERLIVSIMFYAAVSMLFFGAFIVRYRLELVLSFPFVALVMATYLSIGFKRDSAAQAPEKLYREPVLLTSLILCAVSMVVLFFVDVPLLYEFFPAKITTLSLGIK